MNNEEQLKKDKELLLKWEGELKGEDCCRRGCEHSETIGESLIPAIKALLTANERLVRADIGQFCKQRMEMIDPRDAAFDNGWNAALEAIANALSNNKSE